MEEMVFIYFNVYELVSTHLSPQTDFIRRYAKHCHTMNIPTEIMKIENPRSHQRASTELICLK